MKFRGISCAMAVSALLWTGCGGPLPDDENAEEAEEAEEVILPPIAVAEGDGLPDVLPTNLVWQTNNEDESFASPDAVRGGTFRTWMLAFPASLRLVGPDSNNAFAGFLRYNNLGPVTYHPVTRRPIPSLATHWAFGDDGRSIYYRLNPAARWSDGQPVTADDYVFTVRYMRSAEIVAPWYNEYYTDRIRDLKKYDDHTIGIQGAEPKPLSEMHYNYSVGPTPKHFYRMSADFLKEYNWNPQPTTGPYHVGTISKGKFIELHRTEDWWGDDLKYFQNRFNPDAVRITVIRDINAAWQHFLKGELDTFSLVVPQFWYEKATGDPFDDGYIQKYWFYNKLPVPSFGMYLNSSEPLLDNRDIRYGIAHAMNFDKVINTILRGDYERLTTFQLGFGEYDNNTIRPRQFDLAKADAYFNAAGFSKRDDDGIRIRDSSGITERLSFRVTYGRPHDTDRLLILQEDAKKAGLELVLQLLDSSASFKQMVEKKHQIGWMGWATSGLTPRYWEHFHSDNANEVQTNNITNHENPVMDELIMKFRSSSDRAERIAIAHQLEQMVHDSGVVIPRTRVSFTREAAWRWVRVPEWVGTPSTGSIFNTQANSAGIFSSGGLLWIDQTMKDETKRARRDGTTFPPTTVMHDLHRD